MIVSASIVVAALFLQSAAPGAAADSQDRMAVSGGIAMPRSAPSSANGQGAAGGGAVAPGNAAASAGVRGGSSTRYNRGPYGGPSTFYVVPKGSLMPYGAVRRYQPPVQRGGQLGQAAAADSIPNNPFPADTPAQSPAIAPGPATTRIPLYFPPRRYSRVVRPNAARPSAPPVKKEQPPRQPSVYETSGPRFGEVDPLVEYQRAQAAKGNPQSQYALGMRYLTGRGVIQNDDIALEWLRKASANGELRAREKLRQLRRSREEG